MGNDMPILNSMQATHLKKSEDRVMFTIVFIISS